MLKQRIISSFLLCAFAIIFAHSITPHHHHEGRGIGHYNVSDKEDHDDLDHSFFGKAFSFYNHDGGSTIIYEAPSPTYDQQKISIDKDVVLLVQYLVRKFYEPPLTHSENYSFSFCSSLYFDTNPFRGPPVFVG